MSTQAITVTTDVNAPIKETWHYYTESEHVINWNFASEDWHCPKAVNDLRVGGEFTITMAAKSGEMSFDLEGKYDKVEEPKHIAYTLSNGRKVDVHFAEKGEKTSVTIEFEPEADQDRETQKKGWQGILGNFSKYVDSIE